MCEKIVIDTNRMHLVFPDKPKKEKRQALENMDRKGIWNTVLHNLWQIWRRIRRGASIQGIG